MTPLLWGSFITLTDGPGDDLKPTTHTTLTNTNSMSVSLMTSLLAQANTGDKMLEVLEALTSPTVPNTYEGNESNTDSSNYGSLEVIDF